MNEQFWDRENALEELMDSLSNFVKILESNNDTFTFSSRNLVMSAKFRGASWEIRNPVLLGVKADAKLYKTLFEEYSTGGDGGWEIGIIDRVTKRTNLWISKSFWHPDVKEAVSTIQALGTTLKVQGTKIQGLENLDGTAAPSHPSYRTLAFHDNFYRFGLEN